MRIRDIITLQYYDDVQEEALFAVEKKDNFFGYVLFLALLSAFFFELDAGTAYAYNSKAWRERLAARTVVLLVDGELLGDGIMLNSRGELNVTWLERGLTRILNTDTEVDEWVVNGLNYYFSNNKDTRAKIKGRDVFVLNYRALKNWSFDPAKLVVNGYAIVPDDILTRKLYWESELTPGYVGTVAVAAPPLKPGQTVELRYEDAVAYLEPPRLRVK